MTGREKVINALEHKETAGVPKFIWYHPEVKLRLAEKLNIEGKNLDAELGNDLLQDWVSINREMAREVPQGQDFVDEWGIRWKRDGFYNMVVEHPLQDCNKEEIIKYPFPDPQPGERDGEGHNNRYYRQKNIEIPDRDKRYIPGGPPGRGWNG